MCRVDWIDRIESDTHLPSFIRWSIKANRMTVSDRTKPILSPVNVLTPINECCTFHLPQPSWTLSTSNDSAQMSLKTVLWRHFHAPDTSDLNQINNCAHMWKINIKKKYIYDHRPLEMLIHQCTKRISPEISQNRYEADQTGAYFFILTRADFWAHNMKIHGLNYLILHFSFFYRLCCVRTRGFCWKFFLSATLVGKYCTPKM